MRILALDTATAATVAALWDGVTEVSLEARDDPPPRARPSHARALLGLVEDVLARAGGGWGAIDRIAVGVGPGTFTGLRIGVASAQLLARATGRPLVPVSTLESLAAAGLASGFAADRPVMAVIDARRGEAFSSVYTGAGAVMAAGGPSVRIAPQVLAPEALAAQARQLAAQAGGPPLAVGDGALQFRDVLEMAGATVPGEGSELHRVSALWHCRLAETRDPVDPAAIQPDYLRVPDAEMTK